MRVHEYDDTELKGLDISQQIQQVWSSGKYDTVAQVTTAVHKLRVDVPRSAVFWLAFHQIHSAASL